MSRMDKKLKDLLDEQYEKLKRDNEKGIINQMPSVFLTGIVTGIFISYSGLLGLLTGVIIGSIGSKYYTRAIDKLIEYTTERIIPYKKLAIEDKL